MALIQFYGFIHSLGRRTYTSADLCFTTDSILFLSFFRQLHSMLAERNSTKTDHMLRSDCDLKMHVQNRGIPFPYKLRAQNHLFRTLRNLMATTKQLSSAIAVTFHVYAILCHLLICVLWCFIMLHCVFIIVFYVLMY